MHVFWALFAGAVVLADVFCPAADGVVVKILLLCIVNELFCIACEIKKRGG